MASKTYYVGWGGLIRRLDNLNFDPNGNTYTNWVNLLGNYNTSYVAGASPIQSTRLNDVMTIPGNKDKVFIVGANEFFPGSPSTFSGIGYSTNAGGTWLTPGFPGAAIPNHISNWIIDAQAPFYFWEVWCVNSNVIYACGDSGAVIRSLDGGLTFTLHDVPYTSFPGAAGPFAPSITALHFENQSSGVIGSYQSIFVTTTGDTACTWLPTSPLPPDTGVVTGVYKKGNLIIAVTSVYILCSTNGGTSWTTQYTWSELGSLPFLKNGQHLTWHYNQCNETLYLRATGRKNEILQAAYKFGTTNSFVNPVTAAVLTPATAWSTFNNHLYSAASPYQDYYAAHFYSSFEGFLGRTSGTGGSSYSTGYPRIDQYVSNSEILNVDQPVPGFAKDYVLTAIWTEIDPIQYYKLIECGTQNEMVVTLDADTSNLPNTINDTLYGITISGTLSQSCWTNEGLVNCPGQLTRDIVTSGAQIIQDCDTYPCSGCFKLVACEPEYDKNGQPFFPFINVESSTMDLNDYLFQVFQFSEDTPGFCAGKCLYLTTSLSCDPPPIQFPDTPFEVYESCSECIPKCPVELNTRSIRPGFYTPGCPPDYTVRTSCMYAEQVYDEMVSIRYGINICCDHDVDKWDIKKQLLDLKSLYNECLCVSAICPVCVEPCNVTATFSYYIEEPIPPPPPPCLPPSDPVVITLG